MKTVQFPSHVKNTVAKKAVNKTQNQSTVLPLDAQVLRQSLETLIEMMTEMRQENKQLTQKCQEYEGEDCRKSEVINNLNHSLYHLREELDRTTAHLNETLGTNHNWWVRSCELEAELQKIKSEFWCRMRDRFASIKFPTLTVKFHFPRLHVMGKLTLLPKVLIKLFIKIIISVLSLVFRLLGVSSPLKAYLSRFPRFYNTLLHFCDKKQEDVSHPNGHVIKSVIIRQVIRVVKYVEKHPQLAIPLKSWLSRKPSLKARLKRLSYQVPVIPVSEYSIPKVQMKEEEGDDLSGLTASAKRLYRLSVLERERRSLSENTSAFGLSMNKLTYRSGRVLKNLQNYR